VGHDVAKAGSGPQRLTATSGSTSTGPDRSDEEKSLTLRKPAVASGQVETQHESCGGITGWQPKADGPRPDIQKPSLADVVCINPCHATGPVAGLIEDAIDRYGSGQMGPRIDPQASGRAPSGEGGFDVAQCLEIARQSCGSPGR
jgi:hypothetical protein